jgi:hypothetical protein
VIDIAMQVLRKQYGRSIPDPIGMQRSHWGADPFTGGTVPHVPPGASGADYDLLGTPVGPLGFAGDSTTSEVPTLVFGAYLTGQREASRILSQLGLQPPQPPISLTNLPPTPGGGPVSNAPASTPILEAPGGQAPPRQFAPAGQAREERIIIRRRLRRGGGQVSAGGGYEAGSGLEVDAYSDHPHKAGRDVKTVPGHPPHANAASPVVRPSSRGDSAPPGPHSPSRPERKDNSSEGPRKPRRRP